MPFPDDKKAVMRISRLLRLCASPHDGERLNAVRALESFLKMNGSNFNDLAEVIEGGGGISDAEMERIYRAGKEDGYKLGFTEGEKAKRNSKLPAFIDVEEIEHTRMAQICLRNDDGSLSGKEIKFCKDMLRWRAPSERQLEWLKSIYRKVLE